MKYTFFLFLFPVLLAGQSVVSSKDTLVRDGERFSLKTETVYDNGRTSTTSTSMDTMDVYKNYVNAIYTLSNQVSDAAVAALNRKFAEKNMLSQSEKIKDMCAVSVIDSIEQSVYEKIKPLSWQISGLDTSAVPAVIGKNGIGFYLEIKNSKFKIHLFNERWIQLVDLYGKGVNLDLFLWRGAFVSPDYRIILSAKSVNQPQEKRTVISRRGK